MQMIRLTEARYLLADIADRARYKGEHTTVTKHGQPIAVVVSPEWYEAHKGDDCADVNERGSLPPNPGDE